MSEDNEHEGSTSGQSSSGGGGQTAGDPGRTPGTAEGDEQTVDEALEKQEQGQ